MNFQRLWEQMELGVEKEQPIEDSVASVIRTGAGVSDSFWDDFILVINNSAGLSKLLDVPEDKIGGWAEKIKSAVDAVRRADSESDPGKNSKLVKTGLPDAEDGENEELP